MVTTSDQLSEKEKIGTEVFEKAMELEHGTVTLWYTRRFGRTVPSIDPRVDQQREKKKKYPFKCSLCKRRYEKHEHLYDHQVKRCEKRYVSKRWVVKI